MRYRSKIILTGLCLVMAFTSQALAHVSEGGLVLLLPTDIYITSGVAIIILTVLGVGLMPDSWTLKLFTDRKFWQISDNGLAHITSLLSFAMLSVLIWLGFYGPLDPLANLLPLMIWTVFWIGFVIANAVFGNLWHWLNPWTGLYYLVAGKPLLKLPKAIGSTPGIIAYIAFACFYLSDIAPDNPQRLAMFVGGYWLYIFIGMMLFGGRNWLQRAECFTLLLKNYACLSIWARGRIGMAGWQIVKNRDLSLSGALFIIVVLATGTFDGINETFVWLAAIGINPLAFPGRSAVVFENITGLLVTIIILTTVFTLMIKAGLWLVGENNHFRQSFIRQAQALLPIAVAYHFAHYLTSFMVNAQYVLKALSDPLHDGSDYLGLGSFYVTSGFLNHHDTVHFIWISQALAIVTGHVIAILASHAIAVDMFGRTRKAFISQIPLASLMVLYTFIGLWLLACPRGA